MKNITGLLLAGLFVLTHSSKIFACDSNNNSNCGNNGNLIGFLPGDEGYTDQTSQTGQQSYCQSHGNPVIYVLPDGSRVSGCGSCGSSSNGTVVSGPNGLTLIEGSSSSGCGGSSSTPTYSYTTSGSNGVLFFNNNSNNNGGCNNDSNNPSGFIMTTHGFGSTTGTNNSCNRNNGPSLVDNGLSISVLPGTRNIGPLGTCGNCNNDKNNNASLLNMAYTTALSSRIQSKGKQQSDYNIVTQTVIGCFGDRKAVDGDIRETIFSGGKYDFVNFTGTLIDSSFQGTELHQVKFEKDLEDIDFHGATLKDIHFKEGVKLTNIKFEGANWTSSPLGTADICIIGTEVWDGIKYNKVTILNERKWKKFLGIPRR